MEREKTMFQQIRLEFRVQEGILELTGFVVVVVVFKWEWQVEG